LGWRTIWVLFLGACSALIASKYHSFPSGLLILFGYYSTLFIGFGSIIAANYIELTSRGLNITGQRGMPNSIHFSTEAQVPYATIKSVRYMKSGFIEMVYYDRSVDPADLKSKTLKVAPGRRREFLDELTAHLHLENGVVIPITFEGPLP
jgi:hypothetical protein